MKEKEIYHLFSMGDTIIEFSKALVVKFKIISTMKKNMYNKKSYKY